MLCRNLRPMKRLSWLRIASVWYPGVLTATALLSVPSPAQTRAGRAESKSITSDQVTQALRNLSATDLLNHIKVLSSDEFEGRAPGTPGEERSVNYLVNQLKQLGLAPGNRDGCYIHSVPLVGVRE